MKSPKTLIREREGTYQDGQWNAMRLYTYVRPRKNGEATIEVWGAKFNKNRKGNPLCMKKFFSFRTDKDIYHLRDVVRYSSYSMAAHDHLVYHESDIGGRSLAYYLGNMVGKWGCNYVSKTPHDYFPKYAEMLNGWDGTKYKYCAYDRLCGLSAIEYVNLYKEFPMAEIISKSRNFQLLTRKFLGHLASDKAFAKFVAKNHYQISLHHMEPSNIETAWKRGETCEEYMKVLFDRRKERERRRREEEERLERERRKEEMKRLSKWNKKMNALYERIKSICGQYGCFEVIVPKTSAEMYDEANAMENCIGKCYTSNHAMGHDVIVFLHKDGKPCVDLRIDPKKMEIVECRYKYNKDAMQDRDVMCEAEKVRDNLAKVWKEVA